MYWCFMMLQGSGGKTPEKTNPGEEVKGANTVAAVATTTAGDKVEKVINVVVPVDQDQAGGQDQAHRSSVVSPSRYCAIASLDEAAFDEEEQWKERASIITKIDHELYQRYAREIIQDVADQALAQASTSATIAVLTTE